MSQFQVGEVAIMLGVSPSTIRNYTEQLELQPYLSNMATRREDFEGAKERRYLMDDVIVLNTARLRKSNTNTWEDVARMLAEGERDDDLPETAALVMPETRADAYELVVKARQQIINLNEANEALEEKLAKAQQQNKEDIERLMKERADLHETIGALKFMLKLNGIDPETGKKKD